MIKKLLSLLILGCTFILLACGCVKREVQSKMYFEFFDTESYIYSYRKDSKKKFEKNAAAVEELLGEYHKLFDIYYEYSGINNIMTVNKNAGVAPVKVDQKIIDFLIYTKEIYALTNGKTNVAMGSVLKLWHECREDAKRDDPIYRIPTEDELLKASKHCSIDDVIIDEAAQTVYLRDPDMSLDVGAIGKGYATEKAAELLISMGVTSYVLNIGGNLRAIGEKPSGDGWLTGITNPNKSSDGSYITKLTIKDTALVTSGDYVRYYTVDGINYHHIIDPDTLMPAGYFSSISVMTKDSALADALSTALFCMSYEEGLSLVNSIGGIEVIWVDLEYNVLTTPGTEIEKLV